MNIIDRQLIHHAESLQKAKEAMDKAKLDTEYHRLQIKQTKEQRARAKKSPVIRWFIDKMPKDYVEVEPAPGAIYVSINLSAMQYSLYCEDLDEHLELWESHATHDGIGSPVIYHYRCQTELGIHFYITKHITR